MFAKKTGLPEAWVMRTRRWYLKDAEFLSEIGGALAFLGLFLMLCVAGQRAAEKGETIDALTANLFMGLLFITYGMAVSGGVMAVFRLMTAGAMPTYVRYLGMMLAGVAVANALAIPMILGATRLILPLQMFFAWIATTVGFTLLFVMRWRQKAVEQKTPSDVRPVE